MSACSSERFLKLDAALAKLSHNHIRSILPFEDPLLFPKIYSVVFLFPFVVCPDSASYFALGSLSASDKTALWVRLNMQEGDSTRAFQTTALTHCYPARNLFCANFSVNESELW